MPEKQSWKEDVWGIKEETDTNTAREPIGPSDVLGKLRGWIAMAKSCVPHGQVYLADVQHLEQITDEVAQGEEGE